MLDPVTFEMLRAAGRPTDGRAIDRDAFRLIDRAPGCDERRPCLGRHELPTAATAGLDRQEQSGRTARASSRSAASSSAQTRAASKRRMRETAGWTDRTSDRYPWDPDRPAKSQVASRDERRSGVRGQKSVSGIRSESPTPVRGNRRRDGRRRGRAPWNSTFFAEAEAFPDGPFGTIDACSRSHSMLAGSDAVRLNIDAAEQDVSARERYAGNGGSWTLRRLTAAVC